MTEKTPSMSQLPPNEVRLHRSLAQLFVTDFARSLAFYRETLGFEVVFTYGEPPFYGEIARGDATFNLRHVDESPFRSGVRDAEQLLSVAIRVTNASALFVEYEEAGADFQERLQAKPWGAMEFIVRDPDGNLVLFGSPASTT